MTNMNEKSLDNSGGASPATEEILSSLPDADIGSLLQFLAQKANINLGDAEAQLRRKEKEKAVTNCHPFKITQSNGRCLGCRYQLEYSP